MSLAWQLMTEFNGSPARLLGCLSAGGMPLSHIRTVCSVMLLLVSLCFFNLLFVLYWALADLADTVVSLFFCYAVCVLATFLADFHVVDLCFKCLSSSWASRLYASFDLCSFPTYWFSFFPPLIPCVSRLASSDKTGLAVV